MKRNLFIAGGAAAATTALALPALAFPKGDGVFSAFIPVELEQRWGPAWIETTIRVERHDGSINVGHFRSAMAVRVEDFKPSKNVRRVTWEHYVYPKASPMTRVRYLRTWDQGQWHWGSDASESDHIEFQHYYGPGVWVRDQRLHDLIEMTALRRKKDLEEQKMIADSQNMIAQWLQRSSSSLS